MVLESSLRGWTLFGIDQWGTGNPMCLRPLDP